MNSLWPEDIGKPSGIRAPLTILKEQASLLGRSTRNYVEAKVDPIEANEWWVNSSEDVRLGFSIVAPSLGNYRYRLFAIAHSLVQLYPVKFYLDDEIAEEVTFELKTGTTLKTTRYVDSEEDFMTMLEEVFRANKTRQVIQAILAQLGVKPASTTPSE